MCTHLCWDISLAKAKCVIIVVINYHIHQVQQHTLLKAELGSGAAAAVVAAGGSAIKSQHGDGGRRLPRGARDVVERGAVNECRCKGRGGAAGTGVILAVSRERGRRLPSARYCSFILLPKIL